MKSATVHAADHLPLREGRSLYQETIPERGQSAYLLKEDHLAVLYAPGETLLNQAFSLPPFWNGLLILAVQHWGQITVWLRFVWQSVLNWFHTALKNVEGFFTNV
jgi:hypothetical protein